jgi:hypothetical protein
MKKFLVLFVGLAILAGSVCALDLPDALKIPGLDVSGNVRTGFRVTGYSTGKLEGSDGFTSTPKAKAYSDDPGDGNPLRAHLVLQWTKGNLGVKTRFRYDANTRLGASNLVDLAGFVNKAFVWGDVFDKKVRVTVGKGSDAAWASPAGDLSPSDTNNFDGDKDGLKVEVKPIDGLNLGVFYGTDNLFATGVSDHLNTDNLTGTDDRRFVAGAKYSSDRFAVAASWYWNPTDTPYGITSLSENTEFDPADYADLSSALPRTSNLQIGGQVKATDALTLNVNLGFTNLGADTLSETANGGESITDLYKKGDFSPYWFFFGKLAGDYAVSDALTVGLSVGDIVAGSQFFYAKGAVDEDDDPEEAGLGQFFPVTITPSVGYAINDDIELGGELGFKIHQNGSDQFGFKVKPIATFQLGSGAWFQVYDELTFYTESKYARESEKYARDRIEDPTAVRPDYLYEHSGLVLTDKILWKNGHSGSENTFHIEFGWSF